MSNTSNIPEAPIYAHLLPKDIQGDPETKPEASALLRGTYHAFREVANERWRQHVRWGDQSGHPDTTWLAILTEEIGETAQAVLHDEFGGKAAGTLHDELVQVAAVAMAWIEALERRADIRCALCGDAIIGQVDPRGEWHVHAGCALDPDAAVDAGDPR